MYQLFNYFLKAESNDFGLKFEEYSLEPIFKTAISLAILKHVRKIPILKKRLKI